MQVEWRHRLTGLNPVQQAAVVLHQMRIVPSPERLSLMADVVCAISELTKEAIRGPSEKDAAGEGETTPAA